MKYRKGNQFYVHNLKLEVNIYFQVKWVRSTDHQGTVICGKGREWSITGDDGLVQGDIRLSWIDLLSSSCGFFPGVYANKLPQTFEIYWFFEWFDGINKEKKNNT